MGTIIAIIIIATLFVLIKSAIKANKSNKEINPVSPPEDDIENDDK